MTITLTSSTPSVAANAPWGKVIGTFNNHQVRLINDSPAGYFGVTSNTLRVAWHGIQAPPGTYQVTVSAPGHSPATFKILVTAVVTPPPPPPISPDGSIISGGTGSLQTSDGTWTFGPVASGAWKILLNGSWASTGIADKLQVANSGKMYAHNAGGWWIWQSGSWHTAADPNTVVTPPPPPPISPDGSIISGGTGSLQTSDGTWTFGPVASGAWKILLNGSWASTGIADKLQVANSGKMYAHNAGGWWIWQSGSWQTAADPNTPPPVRTLVLTLTPIPASISDTSPVGTVITTATVKYSDGTIPNSVTLTSSDPSFAKISGMDIVTARALITGPQSAGGDDYTHHVTITASDGLGAQATVRLFGGGRG